MRKTGSGQGKHCNTVSFRPGEKKKTSPRIPRAQGAEGKKEKLHASIEISHTTNYGGRVNMSDEEPVLAWVKIFL